MSSLTSSPSMRTRDLFVFVRKGIVWTSNMPYLPNFGAFTSEYDHNRPFWQPSWLTHERPYMAFMPFSRAMDEEMFGHVHFTRDNAPVERRADKMWVIQPETVAKWSTADRLLKHFEGIFFKQGALYHLRYERVPDTTQSGYLGSYASKEFATTAANRTRMSFIARAAEIAYHVFIYRSRSSHWDDILTRSLVSAAVIDMVEQHGKALHDSRVQRVGAALVPRHWSNQRCVEALEASEAPLWFCWARVQDTKDGRQILVDDYGRRDWCGPPILTRHYPSLESALAAKTHTHGIRLKPDGSLIRLNEPKPRPQRHLPGPPPPTLPLEDALPVQDAPLEQRAATRPPDTGSSSQTSTASAIDKQPWLAFFRERAVRNSNKLEWERHHCANPNSVQYAEACAQRDKRRNHRIAALGRNFDQQIMPHRRSSARVYVWEDLDEEGVFVRRLLTREQVAQEWEASGTEYRVYDPFSNEWDICDHFSKDGLFDFESDSDDSDDHRPLIEKILSPPSPSPTSTLLGSASGSSSTMHVGAPQPPPLPHPSVAVSSQPLSLSSVLRASPTHPQPQAPVAHPERRIMPLPARAPPPQESVWDALIGRVVPLNESVNLRLEDELVELYLSAKLGFVMCEQSYRPEHFENIGALKRPPTWTAFLRNLGLVKMQNSTLAATRPLLMDFMRALATSQGPPAYMFDLHPAATSPLQTTGLYFRYETVLDAKGNRWYLMHPRDNALGERTGWTLAIPSAGTVAEVLRRNWGPSPLDLVYELFRRGIRFSTRMLILNPHRSLSSLHPRSFRGFGVRPFGWTMTPREYAWYKHYRRLILEDASCGRAAQCRGGPLGRLARELNAEVGKVYGGPVDITLARRDLCTLRRGEYDLVDDELTPDEIDAICGLYHIAPQVVNQSDRKGASERHTFAHTTQLLLWPRPEAWESSRRNHGEWNESDEHWYRRIRDAYEEGKFGEMKKAAEWVSKLGGERLWERAHKNHEKYAQEFLDQHAE